MFFEMQSNILCTRDLGNSGWNWLAEGQQEVYCHAFINTAMSLKGKYFSAALEKLACVYDVPVLVQTMEVPFRQNVILTLQI